MGFLLIFRICDGTVRCLCCCNFLILIVHGFFVSIEYHAISSAVCGWCCYISEDAMFLRTLSI